MGTHRMRHRRNKSLEILHLLAELLAEEIEVWRQSKRNPLVLLLLRHDDQIPRIQFRQDVSLQRAVETFNDVGRGVSQNDSNTLHWRAKRNVTLLTDIASVLNNDLQRLHCLDSIFVEAALVI